MDNAHALCSQLRKLANKLGDDSRGGLTIKGLSFACDHRYKVMNARFSTTIFFMTRKTPYESKSVLKKLNDRTIPFKHLIPDRTLSDPNFSRNSLLYQFMKKTLETPDDANDDESEDTTEATSEDETEGESDLDPAEPNWKDLFQQNVDQSENEEDPEDFSSPFSTDLITQVELANNLVKRSTSSKNACKPNSISLNRSPHQAFLSLVFGVLASIRVTTIFGGVTSGQISKVQSDVNSLASKQAIIVAQLSHNSKEILVNRAFSEGLKNLTVKLTKFVTAKHFITHGLVMYTLIDAEFDKISDELDQYIDIVESASNNDFHPAVLSSEGAILVFEQIRGQAELQGLLPVINTPQQLSQMKTHFFYTPSGIEIVIDVPLISPDNIFELQKFNPIPISLSPKAYVQLVSDFSIVGLGKKDLNHRALFFEMTFANLEQCERLGEIFLCTKQRIVKKSNAPSCIYSLYYSDHNRAEHSCQINLKGHKHDQSVDTGPNSFVY